MMAWAELFVKGNILAEARSLPPFKAVAPGGRGQYTDYAESSPAQWLRFLITVAESAAETPPSESRHDKRGEIRYCGIGGAGS